MATEPDPPPRAIKPRRIPDPQHIRLPLIVADATGSELFVERTNERVTGNDILTTFLTEPTSIVIAPNAPRLLKTLDQIFGDDGMDVPGWQWRITEMRTEVFGPDREKRDYLRINTVVGFFGFTGKNRKRSRHFHPVEPMLLAGKTIDELRPGSEPELDRLFSWGLAVRDFLSENRLLPKPTKGGLAVQLLRDPRFYPNDRRKIPAATNAKARNHLPGNHYRLYAPDAPAGKPISVESKRTAGWSVTYIDQRAAHHNAAADLAFPDANSLHGIGMFRSLKDRPFAREGSERYDRILKCHGLLYVRLNTPPRAVAKGSFPPPFMDTPGTNLAFIYTNELQMIRDHGGTIPYIIAGWISPHAEPGLNKYARWALDQLDVTDPRDRPWIKPILLTTYGVLASRPRPMEFGWRRATKGDVQEFIVGAGTLSARVTKTTKEVEPGIANVIHRGMIEAETRRRTLAFAAELNAAGQRVLSIYADAVMIESSDRIPLLRPPWRIERHCTDLVFNGPTMFHSPELSKLPGVPRKHQRETMRRLIARASSL